MKMKCQFACLLSVITIFSTLGATAAETGMTKTNEIPPPATLEALQQHIAAVIAQPRYSAAMWGVKIVSLDSGKVWFANNADKLFTPASNSKLYTMALALDTLGPEYRIKTSLYSDAKPDASGVLKGDLIVYGRGDPTISAEYAGGVLKALEPMVAALSNSGVKAIEGDLVGDDSFLKGEPYGSGWSCDDLQNYYGAEISALTLDANYTSLVIKPGDAIGVPAKMAFEPPTDYLTVINHTETVAKGGKRQVSVHHPIGANELIVTGQVPLEEKQWTEDVTFHNPALYFVTELKQVLAAHGITVKGQPRSAGWLERELKPVDKSKWVEIASVQSQSFRDIIRSVEKPSQNLYTDLMLDHIGANVAAASSNSESTSEELGIRELKNFLKRAGVKPGDTLFQDGSGLSRDNLTTPNATVALLTYMNKHKDAKVYYDALPIAGVDGTLKRRFKGTVVEGNLRAKTGTLHWANSLSGYMTNAAGEHLVLSFMLNRYQPAQAEGTKTHDMDEIVTTVARTKFSTVEAGK